MKNKKLTILLSGITLCALSSIASADQLADVKARGSLTCGVLSTFEPFGFTDINSRAVIGYDVDICNAVAKQLGVKAEIKPVSIEARIPELQQGRMDMLAAGLGYSPQRAEQVAFSYRYYVSDHKLTVKASRNFTSPSDLSGKRVSFTKGGITEGFVKKSVPDAKLTGYEDTPTAFTALVQNKVAACSVPEVVGKRLISKLGDKSSEFQLLEPPVGQETWGLAVRNNEPAMLAAVNDSLQKIEQSGEAQQIFDKWLGSSTIYAMKRNFTIAPIEK